LIFGNTYNGHTDEHIISIAKRYNHVRTHYKKSRNRGIKGAKPYLESITLLRTVNYDSEIYQDFWFCIFTLDWKRRRFVCIGCGSKFMDW
jgi:hypothetical protein